MVDPRVLEKAAKVKLLLTDSDGVLTDGRVFYSEQGEALKGFHMRDGMGVERLRTLRGIETGLITRESTGFTAARGKKLKLKYVYLGALDKLAVLKTIAEKLSITPENIGYIGDDVNDLEVLRAVGFSACPGDAMPEIKSQVDYQSEFLGGHGAFRDIAEIIINATKGNGG